MHSPRCLHVLAGLTLLTVGCDDKAPVDTSAPSEDPIEETGADDSGSASDDTASDDTGNDDAAVDEDGDGVSADLDCDDGDPDTYPGAVELCDGVDNDCTEGVPETEIDDDGDGQAECAGDCDDDDADNYTGNAESCDGADNDCDETIDDGIIGSGEACAGRDCADLNEQGAPSGIYSIDPAGTGAYQVYCENELAGGGWQLISSREFSTGALFDEAICLDPLTNCSGHVPPEQLFAGEAPDLMFALADGSVWLTLTGLDPTGSGHLLDVLSLDRLLSESESCAYPNYCDQDLDAGLVTLDSSAGYTPRDTELDNQYARYGGLFFGVGGQAEDHTVSLNYGTYCAPGGLDLSDASDSSLGNVACGAPGGIWFRY